MCRVVSFWKSGKHKSLKLATVQKSLRFVYLFYSYTIEIINYKTQAMMCQESESSRKLSATFIKYSFKFLHKVIPPVTMIYAYGLWNKVLSGKIQILQHRHPGNINLKIRHYNVSRKKKIVSSVEEIEHETQLYVMQRLPA